MTLVFIHEVSNGNNSNLIVDFDKKHFKYLRGALLNPEAIRVKSKKEIDKLIDKLRDDGYALKLG